MVLASRSRNSRQRSHSYALSLEELLISFAAKLTTGPDQIESVIENTLFEVRNLIGSACVSWYEEDPSRKVFEVAVYSTGPELQLLPSTLARADLPYTFEALSNGIPVILRSPEDVPTEASQDRTFLLRRSMSGLILIPSDSHTQRRGVLAVAYTPQVSQLTDKLVSKLIVLNNLIATSVERKRIYAMLHESDERFRGLFRNIPIGIAVEDLAGKLLFVNPALCSMLGYSDKELVGTQSREILAREQNDEDALMFEHLRHGLIDQYRTEKQFIRNDGTRTWGRVDVALLSQREENPLVIRMVEDISEQKDTDDELLKTRTELEQLAEHLIKAQEEERHRISRELHDDIAQRLSLLSIGIDSLSQCLANTGCDRELQNLSELKAQLDTLATDVHSLSHRLHSTRLQHLGLRSAVEELTKQLSKQHKIPINLSTYGWDTLLPSEVALCLFRVTQEALNNAVRHSHAQFISVELKVEEGLARLQINDTGVGFDVSDSQGGIGLVSMRERLRIVGGELSVQSRRGEGTLITATVGFGQILQEMAA